MGNGVWFYFCVFSFVWPPSLRFFIWLLVSSFRFPVSSLQFPVYPVSSFECPVSSFQFPVFQFPVFRCSFQARVSSFYVSFFQISGIRFLFLVSSSTSSFQVPFSSCQFAFSDSCSQFPVSSFSLHFQVPSWFHGAGGNWLAASWEIPHLPVFVCLVITTPSKSPLGKLSS